MFCIFHCFKRKITDEEQEKIKLKRLKILPLYKKIKYYHSQ